MRVGTYPNEDNSCDAFEQGSSIICVLSYDQAQDILLGINLHWIGFCKWKVQLQIQISCVIEFQVEAPWHCCC